MTEEEKVQLTLDFIEKRLKDCKVGHYIVNKEGSANEHNILVRVKYKLLGEDLKYEEFI